MKVDDEIVELEEWDAVRIPPGAWRGYEAGPEGLEIEANDVRCTHAATVARLDEGQIFYLQSRGLDRADAEHLLVGGFLEVIAGRLEGSPFLHDTVSAALQRELELVLA